MSKQLYTLDPDTNTVTHRVYTDTISNLDEFVAALASDRDIVTPALPLDCVQYQSSQQGFTYYIHKPAAILKVGASGLVGTQQILIDNLEVAVPDRLYVFRGEHSINSRICRFVFTAAKDRETFKQVDCSQPWLPNMYSGYGAFCGGPEFENICVDSGSVTSRIDRCVAYMEKSMFNNDLDYFIGNIPLTTRARAEDCFGVDIEGVDWSSELRSAVESGGWRGSLKAVLRLHLATKRMLNEQGELACLAAARADLAQSDINHFSLESCI